MKSVTAVISTLFRCGIVGGLYGAVLGVIYVGLLGVSEALRTTDVTFLAVPLPGLMLFGAIIGFPAGFISGVLGASLGGPIGYSIGGVIGTGAIMLPFVGGAEGLRSAMPVAIYPSVWGAAFGLVLGLHLRRRVPLLPGAKWLAANIYSSPLGGWLGWRQGHLE
jgi:hypothetical protein